MTNTTVLSSEPVSSELDELVSVPDGGLAGELAGLVVGGGTGGGVGVVDVRDAADCMLRAMERGVPG